MGDDPAATDGEETDTGAETDATRADADGARTPGGRSGEEEEAPSDPAAATTGGTTASDATADMDVESDRPTDETAGDGGADGDVDAVADGDSDGDGAQADESEETDREGGGDPTNGESGSSNTDRPPEDVRKYERFKKVDGAQYDRVNDFLRDRTYITAREWAIARLCADFRTETGVEMTKIGNNLPYLVPFMTDTYSPQAVNQARHAFREKVRKSGATFLYGAMCGFFTAEELDELMYEVSEIAKFLLEVEGVDLAVAEELGAEERISSVMREVREASSELRAEDLAEPSDD